MSEERKLSNERLDEMLAAEIPLGMSVADARSLITEVQMLRPYKEELEKIAADLGEPDDPFAAWEALAALRASSGVEPVGWVTAEILAAMKRGDPAMPGWKQSGDFRIPLYASPLPTVEVTGALIDAGAHALEHGTDLSLSWEEFCTVSELVLRTALSQNKGEE